MSAQQPPRFEGDITKIPKWEREAIEGIQEDRRRWAERISDGKSRGDKLAERLGF